MKKLIIIIIGAFTLLFGVNVKGTTFYTLDTQIAELNNHSLREVFEDNSILDNDFSFYKLFQDNVNSVINISDVVEWKAPTLTGIQGSLQSKSVGFTPINSDKYYINLDIENIKYIVIKAEYIRVNGEPINISTNGIHSYIFNTFGDSTVHNYINFYQGNNELFSYLRSMILINITSLGIDNLTVEQIDYWYIVYKDLLKDINRVSQLPNLFIDLFNELTDNFLIGIKGFTQLIYLDGYGLTDLGIISLIVIAISVIGIGFYIIRRVIK